MKTSILTLGIALALLFAAAPSEAALTEGQKCAMKANLLSGKFSLCLNKADANVSKGKAADTAAADGKCDKKYLKGWDKTREKAQEKDAGLGADCAGAMSNEVRDSVKASALIALGRDLTAFAVSDANLADDSGVQELIDEAVAEVDITSDNAAAEQAGCEAAGGTWESGTCTAASSYNCAIGATCSYWAAADPGGLPYYTNNYAGDTAASSACDPEKWEAITDYLAAPAFPSQYFYPSRHVWMVCE